MSVGTVHNDVKLSVQFSQEPTDRINSEGNATTTVPGKLGNNANQVNSYAFLDGWHVDRRGAVYRHGSLYEADDNYMAPATVTIGGCALLLDELVARAFVERPRYVLLKDYPSGRPEPIPFEGLHICHIDGDWRNCAADNLHWVIDAEWFTWWTDSWTRQLMRGPHRAPPVTKATNGASKGRYPHPYSRKEPLWVDSDSLVGWVQTEAL